MVFVPKSHTTSPCGGCRSLFFASAKKTNEKKADPAGGRAIRLFLPRWLRRTARSVGWPLSYRLRGHRNCMTQWSRCGAPDRFARCAFGHLPFAVRSTTILPALVVSWFCLWRRAPGYLMPCRTDASGALLWSPPVSWWAPWPGSRGPRSHPRRSPSETKPRNQPHPKRRSTSLRERQMCEWSPHTRSGAAPRNPWVMQK